MIRDLVDAVALVWRRVLESVAEALDEIDAFGQLFLDLPPGLAPRLLGAIAWCVAAAGLVGAWTAGALP